MNVATLASKHYMMVHVLPHDGARVAKRHEGLSSNRSKSKESLSVMHIFLALKLKWVNNLT